MKKIAIAAAALLVCASGPVRAQDYPNAPIHLISGFPAGSTADISARVVGARMGHILGQQIVVENRLGAASSIAGAQAARAPKDGYTLFVASAANMINAAMNSNLNFDIMKDFAPVTLITSTPTVLAVIPDLGVKSVKELTALAKEKPDTLSFGTSGTGSSTHLALELYKSLAKVKITHVPYTGSPQVITDMLAGRIQGYFSPASTVAGHVAAGKLVALAVTDAKRSVFFPDLPTMVEAGVPDCEFGAVVRHLRARRHAPADHRQAFARGQRGAQVGRGDESVERADRRGHGRHAGRVPQAYGSRAEAMERGRRGGRLAQITG